MKINKDKIGINVLMASLAVSGLLSITTGATLNKKVINKKGKNKVYVKVIQRSTANKNVVPVLKEITIEPNMPLSVDVKDYIENIDELSKTTLKKCKLDTSLINVAEPGTYTYQITYKEKKYNGIVNVKEKTPVINNITLKNIRVELGGSLPKNINDYITEEIPEEAKSEITIDLSGVNTKVVGTYQYSVAYQNKIYTGTVEIYENKQTFIENTDNKSQTTVTQNTQTENTGTNNTQTEQNNAVQEQAQ